jgi:hypothetical protein
MRRSTPTASPASRASSGRSANIRLADLPKNSYGKVLKTALREAVAATAK